MGENGVIWKANLDMKRMFTSGKLLWGAVPPSSTATPSNIEDKKSKCRKVPTGQTKKIETEVAEITMQGKSLSNGMLMPKSEVFKSRGDLPANLKSTKLNRISSTVTEMRNIWEDKYIPKNLDGPIFVKPLGEQDARTGHPVFGQPMAPS